MIEILGYAAAYFLSAVAIIAVVTGVLAFLTRNQGLEGMIPIVLWLKVSVPVAILVGIFLLGRLTY